SHEAGVSRLIALGCQLRLDLVELVLRRLQRGLAPLEFGAADEVLVLQGSIAPEIRRRQVPIGGRRGDLGPGRIRSQTVVLRIQLRQHLPCLDALTDLSLALGDLACHAKAKTGLDARPYLAGEFMARLNGVDA